jgi:hypothetical protein
MINPSLAAGAALICIIIIFSFTETKQIPEVKPPPPKEHKRVGATIDFAMGFVTFFRPF